MFEPLAQWLSTSTTDVLCVQEVTRTAALAGWTRFEDSERTLPQRANLFNDIATLLPNHQGIFVASDAGPVWGPEESRHLQDFGIAMFVHERLPVVGQHSAFVYGDFVEHADWSIADRPRIAQSARMIDRETHRTFTVAHLHGLRDPAGKADTPQRSVQAQRFAKLVETARQPDDFVVACGDFNLLPDSDTFDVLGSIGLVDLVGNADTRTTRYTKPVRHANYMLVSEPGSVRAFSAPPTPEVSDHRMLILEI